MARSLMPKEHGAYGQLAFPAASALLLGRPTLASVALVVSACALFFAHEPWLVLLGRRGTRARREDGRPATRALAASLTMGGLCAGIALARAPSAAWALAPSVALGALVVPLVIAGKEKTLAGELLVATALSSLALPVALMSGVRAGEAAAVALVWTASFGLATLGVREAMARRRLSRRGAPRSLMAPIAVAVVVAVAAAKGWWVALAVAPFVAACALLVLAPPAPRHMKRVGWSLIGASGATLAAVALIPL